MAVHPFEKIKLPNGEIYTIKTNLIYTCKSIVGEDMPTVFEYDKVNHKFGTLEPDSVFDKDNPSKPYADRRKIYECIEPKEITVRIKDCVSTEVGPNIEIVFDEPVVIDEKGAIKATVIYADGNRKDTEFSYLAITPQGRYIDTDGGVLFTKSADNKVTQMTVDKSMIDVDEFANLIITETLSGNQIHRIILTYTSRTDVNRYLYGVADKKDGTGVEWIPISSAGGGSGGDINDPGHAHNLRAEKQYVGLSTNTTTQEIDVKIPTYKTPTVGSNFAMYTLEDPAVVEEQWETCNFTYLDDTDADNPETLVLGYKPKKVSTGSALVGMEAGDDIEVKASIEIPNGLAVTNRIEAKEGAQIPPGYDYMKYLEDPDDPPTKACRRYVYEVLTQYVKVGEHEEEDPETGEIIIVEDWDWVPMEDDEGFYIPAYKPDGTINYAFNGGVFNYDPEQMGDGVIEIIKEYNVRDAETGITLE